MDRVHLEPFVLPREVAGRLWDHLHVSPHRVEHLLLEVCSLGPAGALAPWDPALLLAPLGSCRPPRNIPTY